MAVPVFKRIREQASGSIEWLRGLPKNSKKPADKDGSKSIPDIAPSKRQEIIAAIIVCIALAAVVAGGIVLYNNQKDNKPPATANQKANGYTLTPPTGWARIKPTPEGVSVAFAAATADTDATGSLKAFIVVQSAALNKQAEQATFEDIAKAYVAQLAQSYTDYQLVSTSYKTIAGTPSLIVQFTSNGGKAAVTTESLFTVKDGISYTANGEALTSAWSQHAAAIEQSLLTFRP